MNKYRSQAAWIFVLAVAALVLYVLVNQGLSLLNEPNDTLVFVGYVFIVTAVIVLYEAIVYGVTQLKKGKHETTSSND